MKRISSQEEFLLRKPRFADPNDSTFREIREMDFKNMIREALAIEISSKKGDWEVPTEQEINQAASTVVGPKPQNFVKSEVRETVENPEAPPPTGGKWKIRGETGIYEVALSEAGEWSCTCPSRVSPCKHVLNVSKRLREAGPPEVAKAVDPTDPFPGVHFGPPNPKAIPKGLNTAFPTEGVMIGGGERPSQPAPEDSWAPPKAVEKITPVGSRVTFGSGTKKR